MDDDRKIPATMSTQHPDNANLPSWCGGTIIEGDAEIFEAYFAYSELGCHEVMWDSEGKDVDTHVVRKLLDKHPEFFVKHQLGKDIFLTYRIPNPKIEGAERKVFVETLYNIPVACDVASAFYKREVTPIFEVILPFTTNSKELLWLHNYYRKTVATVEEAFLDSSSKVKDWIGCFQPKNIEVIPLIEDFDSILAADKIVEPYIKTVKPKYLRVFIARSDPALNYGLPCAVLLSKLSFSKLKLIEKKLNINIHLILGVGSMPFRGHLSPENIDAFLNEYRGLSTVTIQSALKYDYPIMQVKECVNTLNKRLPNGEPMIIDPSEEEKLVALLCKGRECYERIVEGLAPLINSVASYVPARRARKLHIGLFGYTRKVRGVTLPRAIPFAGALYTLGLPPELLGGKFFAELDENEWKITQKYYVNLKHDLTVAGGYLSWRNIDMLKDACELVAKNVGMSGEKLRGVLNEVLGDLETIEKTFGIRLGPKSSAERKHENFANNFLISYIEGDKAGASASLLEAAKTRKCLG
ncbi:MAG: phosphoenolpyruvate carboxylase [Nitrososphaerota archaeon]|nr:phosphoenolpyruvate carboxylase [Candidatus Bathyarchaeota archaeon]MDW8023864.1 phosphoenolpyruvate carboxylase [Nitrososphaerota archaeon]